MSEGEVMSAGFEPPTQGRPTLVPAEPVIRALGKYAKEEGPHRWVAFRTYSLAEARSLRRQLTQRGYDASIAREDGDVVLYARMGDL